MSPLSLEDALAMEGGAIEEGESFPGLPEAAILDTIATLQFLVEVYLTSLKDRDEGLYIALTRSSGLACRVRQLSGGTCVILVPAGLVGRLRTLCRTLLRYWDKERHIAFANSPLDKIAEEEWQVPPKLAPLFDRKDSGEAFWKHLHALDDSLDLDPRFDPDVSELMHLGLVFVMCHEFAHVFFRHFEFVSEVRRTRPDELGRIRRGLELHADSYAGTWATTIYLGQMEGNPDAQSLARGFLRQSYVVTAILAMFDAQKKFVGLFDTGDYNHPLIRREVFADACRNEAGALGKEFLDFWEDMERQGWKRAVNALDELNLDAMLGKFGKVKKGKDVYPVQSMTYGAGASFPTLQKILDEGSLLLRDVKEQVVVFNKGFDGGR